MNCNFVNKICLGTVQFGLSYGIANKSGKLNKEEAFKILDFAYNNGITTLDTAYSYGNSEKIIGEFNHKIHSKFFIVSKLPHIEVFDKGAIEEAVMHSLDNLGTRHIYGYLVHKIDDFIKMPKLWDVFVDLKRKEYIEKIGFSLYTVSELENIIKRDIPFDIIQVPYSVFDRRFEEYFYELNKKGKTIYVRSVFLQGLVFLKPEELKGKLQKAKSILQNFHNFCKENAILVNALCLNFALLNPFVDKVIIGVDNLEHLKANINDLVYLSKVKENYLPLEKFIIHDEDVILPYRWN